MMNLTDQGIGFDLHGRGIAMSKVMSFDGIEYMGNGNAVVIAVRPSAQN